MVTEIMMNNRYYSNSRQDLLMMEPIANSAKACKCCGSDDLIHHDNSDFSEFWECRNCEFIFKESIQKFFINQEEKPSNNKLTNGLSDSIEFLCPAFVALPDKQMKILDFGCGTSSLPMRLRKMDHRVIAVDKLPPKEHHPDRLTGDIMDLQIPHATFDLIYAHKVFDDINKPRHIIRRLAQLLKTNGIISIYNKLSLNNPDEHNEAGSFNFQSCNHSARYSSKTFEILFETFGCRVIHTNGNGIMAKKVKDRQL